MRVSLLFGLLFGWPLSNGFGQGLLVINNRVGEDVNAPIILEAGGGLTPLSSPDFSVSFFGGPVGIPQRQLVPLDPPRSNFGPAGSSDAGYFEGVTATVPGVLPGQRADIWIYVNFGGSGFHYDIGPYSINTGDGLTPPPIVPLGTAPILIYLPEPSVASLGLLAAGVILFVAASSRESKTSRCRTSGCTEPDDSASVPGRTSMARGR
jgi:hypothetical protein